MIDSEDLVEYSSKAAIRELRNECRAYIDNKDPQILLILIACGGHCDYTQHDVCIFLYYTLTAVLITVLTQ